MGIGNEEASLFKLNEQQSTNHISPIAQAVHLQCDKDFSFSLFSGGLHPDGPPGSATFADIGPQLNAAGDGEVVAKLGQLWKVSWDAVAVSSTPATRASRIMGIPSVVPPS